MHWFVVVAALVGGGWLDPDEPRGIYVVVPENPEVERFGPGPKHRILYLHRSGGVYTPGFDDSSKNRSSIISQNRTVPPYEGSFEDWQEIVACVKEQFAPYAIEVTDVEPPPEVPYIESVVGGRASDLGLGPGIGGISSGGVNCNVMERGINFTFSQVFPSPARVCEVIAQEAGHNFALDHEFYCPDPMTYLTGCGIKRFQDYDAPCGEGFERACRCGGDTQNSHRIFLDVLGPADDVPPTVRIISPADGDAVDPQFTIEAEATDDVRVDRVEFYIDGQRVGVDSQSRYRINAPVNLAIGVHTVEVRAIDGDENMVPDSITVNLPPQCAADADCGEGRTCLDQRCLGTTGTICELKGECATGLCYFEEDTRRRFCTDYCASDSECPSGFACITPQFGAAKCLPGDSSTGCTVRPGAAVRTGTWLLILAPIVTVFARRLSRRSRERP